ncbi:hypothetical protein A2U01_0083403, partial [Trifolium medium]|nr:hypothetical protein [Trifolium medium]
VVKERFERIKEDPEYSVFFAHRTAKALNMRYDLMRRQGRAVQDEQHAFGGNGHYIHGAAVGNGPGAPGGNGGGNGPGVPVGNGPADP